MISYGKLHKIYKYKLRNLIEKIEKRELEQL